MHVGVAPIWSPSSKGRCCIAGSGPAGLMLGYLLARAGIEVLVLEKHADFLRDFRGDTVHPSTLELIHELGILQEFLKLPHQRLDKVRARIGDTQILLNDMTTLGTRCKFLVLMPQWSFLNFLAEQARCYPTFRLKMQTEVRVLIEDQGRVRVDRLRRWYRPGLLCIGDAAHAMSPIGGVGVNLAIQDAVAAANILAGPLHKVALCTNHLAKVQPAASSPPNSRKKCKLLCAGRSMEPRGFWIPKGPLARAALGIHVVAAADAHSLDGHRNSSRTCENSRYGEKQLSRRKGLDCP